MKKIYYPYILALLLTTSVYAQEVQISNESVIRNNDKVTVSFTARIDRISTNDKLTITPVLYADGAQKSLAPVVVMGRNKKISEKRVGSPQGEQTGKAILYTVTIPFEKWMYGSSLRIDRKLEGCCTKQTLASYQIAGSRITRPEPVVTYAKEAVPQVSQIQQLKKNMPFLLPMTDYKVANGSFDALREKGLLTVYFEQAGTTIDPQYKDNAKSLEQVRKVLKLIEDDPNATLGRIVVAGGSSPEGTLVFNERVAQQRAEDLKRYLSSSISPDVFDIVNVGEDWTGLRRKVEASTMPDRNLVLATIDKYTVRGGRELELMKLRHGNPYRYMLKEFFPDLRSAGYIQIFYELKPDIEFINTGRAIELINNKQYKAALEVLKTLAPTADTNNLAGVCHMMLGNEEQAGSFFEKAIEAGSPEAIKNKEQLSR